MDDIEENEESMSDEDRDLHKQQEEKEKAEQRDNLDRLGVVIAELRSEAIDGRSTSGIEDIWREDEEFYEGVDDRNRGENGSWKSKPPGRVEAQPNSTGSTVFLNITGQYVDSAAASMGDMLLPTDDNGFSLSATPVAEMVPVSEGNIPEANKQEILQSVGGDPKLAAEVEGKVIKKAILEMEEATLKAEKAQKRIEDWHVECQYTAEVRKVIEDASRIGSGVLKGPIPRMSRALAFIKGEMVTQEVLKPISTSISPWALFPDPGCTESIHDGSYIFERDYITSKALKSLKGSDYLDDQIDAIIEEGPSEATKEAPKGPDISDDENAGRKKQYEIWYFYGEIKKEDMEAAGCECEEDVANAQVTMVNNRIIKATINPLDDGEFPYDVMVWKRRSGSPWGTGVARLIRTPQRVINGAARNLMDNAGLSGGPMWAYKRGVIEPIDGVPELAPRKGWVAAEGADEEDMSKAFTYFKMDMMVNELQAIIQMGLKFAEDVTGLPMIMQGQMGASQPDTLGQTQILNNNASTVRRRIARLFDDLVTEPHVRRYYKYLLAYGENDGEKGDFMIDARGSSNLVERSIQKEQILQMGQMVMNPVYGIDPKKWAKEYLRSEKFDAENFVYDDDEWRQVVEKMSQPQQNDPRLQVAQMRAEVDQAIEQMRLQSKEKILAATLQQEDEHQDKALQAEASIIQMKQAFDAEMLKLKQAGVKDNILDESKVRINETVMRLQTQKELSGTNAATPIVEPRGRAAPGRAYEQ